MATNRIGKGKSNANVLRPLRNARDLTTKPRDAWIVDFGKLILSDAQFYEQPFERVQLAVKPYREQNRDKSRRENWWLHGRTGDDLRAACANISRAIVTPRVAKHRVFLQMSTRVYVDDATALIARADDATFGILHSRFHELWSLRMGTSLEDRPRYTPTTCFETFPFPAGLTPADTAHQRTEIVEGGALIPGNWGQEIGVKFPATVASQRSEAGVVRMSGPISKSEAYEAPASESAPPSAHQQVTRQQAIRIAIAAKKLNDLREAWLNPPEWTHKVPEVTPLGMTQSPYPDRIEPKPGISEQDLNALQKRTLTNLYNARPAWLGMAHSQLDAAVAAAYGWTDYSPDMPDEEILKRLLVLNLERSAAGRGVAVID